MWSSLVNMVKSCWFQARTYDRLNRDNRDDNDDGGRLASSNHPFLWFRDLERHSGGEFSFAVVQANGVVEDWSQVEVGQNATFVGVYDGHGGPDAAKYLSDHLFDNLTTIAREIGAVSEDALRSAVVMTEENFTAFVNASFERIPKIEKVGSCCLIGMIWGGKLYLGNLGDSRAVMGCLDEETNQIMAEQLTRDHNARLDEVREELRSLYPDDPDIVVLNARGEWRVKGIIQVTRAIGNVYLKRPEYSAGDKFRQYRLEEPLFRSVLSADPSISSRTLQQTDKFIIFASDGLWDFISNEEAVNIVHNNPRRGIARRLLRMIFDEICRRRQMTYDEVKGLERGERRDYHDDITVVVLFLDHKYIPLDVSQEFSLKGFQDNEWSSHSSRIRHLTPNVAST